MESQPGVGMVYGHAQYFESGNRPARVRTSWRGTKVWPGADWVRLRCRSAHNCISSPEVVVRTSVQRPSAATTRPASTRATSTCGCGSPPSRTVAYIRGAVQAIYRIHSDSMLRSDADPMVDLTERRPRSTGSSAAPSVARRRRPAAGDGRRALARQALWQASRAYDRGEVGGVPVDDLIAFALRTCPDARSLREWRGLQLRRRIGAGRSLWFPPFVATGAAHRLRGHVDQLRWRTRGV